METDLADLRRTLRPNLLLQQLTPWPLDATKDMIIFE